MDRLVRTPIRIFAAQQRTRVDGVIRELITLEMNPKDTSDDLENLVNHIIIVNSKM